MLNPVSIIHGVIGLISLAIVLGMFMITARGYYILAPFVTTIVAISGFTIKFAGLTEWWRIGLETLATILVYGWMLYKNRSNLAQA